MSRLKRDAVYTMAQVREQGYVVVEDKVYDVSRFVDRHPGGDQLKQLMGQDATFLLLNAHGNIGVQSKAIRGFCIGRFDGSGRDRADNELLALLEKYRSEGLFETSKPRLVGQFSRFLLTYLLGWGLSPFMPWLAFLLLCIAHCDVIFFIHDIAHNSVFKTQRRAKLFTEGLGIMFLGTPVLEYHYRIHRMHHVFTNIMGLDGALDTGPIVWDSRMAHRSRPFVLRWQATLWLFVILPLFYPYFLVTSTKTAWINGRYKALMALALRWLILVPLLSFNWMFLLLPPMIAGFWLTLLSSLNHFHLPISEGVESGFVGSVSRAVQNLHHRSSLGTWLTGGLNYHIEHHLFATMPSHRYAQISPDIRALFKRHSLPYRSAGFVRCLGSLWTKLKSPYEHHGPPENARFTSSLEGRL